MNQRLKCFISSSYDIDLSMLKNILAEHDIDTFDIYDFSIGDSIQQILKRKIRQSDFAIFVVSKDSPNVLYEMGVCEGLGKQHFIFLEKDYRVPIYLENKLFIRADLNDRTFLKMSVDKILQSLERKPTRKNDSIESSSPKGKPYTKDSGCRS